MHKRDEIFPLIKRFIGVGGNHAKAIANATGAKVRVRGKGSGHIEPDGKEATIPLMVAVTMDAQHKVWFPKAVQLCVWRLEELQLEFDSHCHSTNLTSMHLWSYGEMSLEAESLLREAHLLILGKETGKLRHVQSLLKPDRPASPGPVLASMKQILYLKTPTKLKKYLAGENCYLGSTSLDPSIAMSRTTYEQATSSHETPQWVPYATDWAAEDYTVWQTPEWTAWTDQGWPAGCSPSGGWVTSDTITWQLADDADEKMETDEAPVQQSESQSMIGNESHLSDDEVALNMVADVLQFLYERD